MKNKLNLLWLIAVIGLAAIACDNGNTTDPDNKTTPNPCADGHTFTEWEETTKATCTDAAIDTEKCSVCGELGTETDVGHDPLGCSANGAIEATCFDVGYTGTGNCIRCGTYVQGKEVPKLTHHYHGWTDSACTTLGSSTRDCTNDCGTKDTRTVGIGHDWNWATYTSGIRKCQRDSCLGTVGIGDTGPAGGIIFYVVDDGFTVQGYGSSGDNGYFAEYTAYYLEAAPANETSSIWQSASDNTIIEGVTTFTSVGQNNTLTIGVGRKDTQTIVNSTAFAALTNTAAQRCANKTLNGFTDWFLPSLGELNEFYKLKGQAGVPQTGIPTTGWLWSSSQGNKDAAWLQDFVNGTQHFSNKISSGGGVRAIRAF